jgi:hypothetical protein
VISIANPLISPGPIQAGGTNGGLSAVEGTGANCYSAASGTGLTGSDCLWFDSATHQPNKNPNNAGAAILPGIASAGTAGHGIKLATNGIDLVDTGSPVVATTVHTLSFPFGAPGGTALTASILGYFTVPVACTITGWDIAVDAGTATVKTLKVAAGTAIPTLGSNSISTSGVAISSGTVVQSTTLTDFTTAAIAAHDIIAADMITTSGVGYINFQLEVTCGQ